MKLWACTPYSGWKQLSSALLWKELSELMSDTFRAVCSAVWSMPVLCSSRWWLCVVMCCFRVWLPGKVLVSVSHYSITDTYTQTQRREITHIAWVYELSRYGACIIWTVLCFLFFVFFSWCVKEWLQSVRVMKYWVHSQGCKSLHICANGRTAKSSAILQNVNVLLRLYLLFHNN